MTRIVLPEKPPIVHSDILEDTKKLISKFYGQITVDDFADNVFLTCHAADKWHAFARANLRITEKGCDKISITSVYALIVEYSIFDQRQLKLPPPSPH